MRLFGIFGASGCGRGIMPLLRDAADRRDGDRLVFVDDRLGGATINGHAVVTLDDFMRIDAASRQIVVAIADPATRRQIVARCNTLALDFFSVRAAQSVVMDDVAIAQGALISPFVTFTSNIRIGSHFHANLYSYVEHDCVIGDFVTFAPGAACNGNVHIGDGAYVGAGAVIRQGTPEKPMRIGAGAVIGMGAVVTRDVADGQTVVGNPARLRIATADAP